MTEWTSWAQGHTLLVVLVFIAVLILYSICMHMMHRDRMRAMDELARGMMRDINRVPPLGQLGAALQMNAAAAPAAHAREPMVRRDLARDLRYDRMESTLFKIQNSGEVPKPIREYAAWALTNDASMLEAPEPAAPFGEIVG